MEMLMKTLQEKCVEHLESFQTEEVNRFTMANHGKKKKMKELHLSPFDKLTHTLTIYLDEAQRWSY